MHANVVTGKSRGNWADYRFFPDLLRAAYWYLLQQLLSVNGIQLTVFAYCAGFALSL
jgi:hypothetical protein